MLKLDEDMEKAMGKIKNIRKINKFLPGIDCGGCGSPTCRTLAEDVVQGEAKTSDCIYLQNALNCAPDKPEKAEDIWGKGRFDKIIP